MAGWTIVYSKQAQKDAVLLADAGLKERTERLLRILADDPFSNSPRYERLVGRLSGLYFRRINIQHRLVYAVDAPKRTIHVLRMWTHYL